MSGTGTEKRRLLVVEDDPGLQTQLKWAYDDYAVLIAGDHDSAIEWLRAEEPAVVTLDLGLPPDPDGTREGFRVLRAILEMKRSEEHTSELQSLMRISYAVFCLKKKTKQIMIINTII